MSLLDDVNHASSFATHHQGITNRRRRCNALNAISITVANLSRCHHILELCARRAERSTADVGRTKREVWPVKRLAVALFSDSHYEANGVARTTCALERYATDRECPLLSVHAGPGTSRTLEGSVVRLQLKRARYSAFRLEHDLQFDVLMWRHLGRVMRELET